MRSGGIQGNFLSMGDQGGGLAGPYQGRDLKFPGHGGHVPGNAAHIGDDAADPPDERNIAGRGLGCDQDRRPQGYLADYGRIL